MGYLKHLQHVELSEDSRWIVKYNSNGKIKEVKLIWDPEQYKTFSKSRELFNKSKLIKILQENERK